MRRRRLGRTGLTVSEISLGTVELGLEYGIGSAGERLRPDEDEAAALLRCALEHGVNLIDTARAYGDSEAIIGRALRGRRGEFYLISKTPSQPGRPDEVARLVETSLRELQTSYLDVLMVHCRADEMLPDDGTLEAIERLREQGKVRFTGASVYPPEAAMACIRSGRFDCLEIACNMLDRRPEREVLAAASARDIGIVARSVLLKGALTARCRLLPHELDALRAAAEALAGIAGSIGRLPALAYRYVLSLEPPHTLLAGTARREELLACIGYAASGPLTAAELAAVRRIDCGERWLNPANWPPLLPAPGRA